MKKFGDEDILPARKFDRNLNAWRNYTASLCSMANPQDDCDQNLEVDIHPKEVQVVNKGSQPNVNDLEKLKAFLDSKIQAQNEAFHKYKETQECEMQILKKELQVAKD